MRGVALITGASSGLGYGLARELARKGYAIGAVARRREALEGLADEIRGDGGRVWVGTADVAEREHVAAAAATCAEALGPVDLLVANAGISIRTDARSLSAADVERVMRVNFLGAVYAVEAVLPGMLERGHGQLVGMGSLAGYGGLARTGAYSASKGALHNFFESMRLDLRGTGVDVTMLTPGYVKTPLTDAQSHAMPFLVDTDDAVDRMVRAILRRDALLSFPFPMAAAAWLAQALPSGLYDMLAGRIRRG